MNGIVLIEVCDANPACTSALFALEHTLPGVTVLETSCMSQCDLCATRPYVFVNGELVTADTVEALIQRVRQRVAAWLTDDPDVPGDEG
ncbi:hypothetical protein GCM10010885_01310 [Alicyclobacillus cellulosilyticus]|uniref:Uncharacterized protein n=1 Tax=Alicyclobacillus cellulosilyticus TaxID=1003997 RepID=A0A917K0A2_9BACL|nr:DUF1450 domain-containing protein [Alicyclobacillus cellulosilyticus]GGI95443.1 hypothetical protein GCM10010885_01310 [Alicyclobacillus cellulosilyticus]